MIYIFPEKKSSYMEMAQKWNELILIIFRLAKLENNSNISIYLDTSDEYQSDGKIHYFIHVHVYQYMYKIVHYTYKHAQ